MKLLDKYGNATATVISQIELIETDVVYNFEVQGFHTYYIGEVGIWVHNANCCDFTNNWGSIEQKFKAAGWVDPKTNKVRYLDPFDGKLKDFPDNVKPSVDHILPRAEAKKIAGNKLSAKELNYIVNAPENLMPLPQYLNSSKGSKAENATGDDGGHLIASTLGGAGDRINMVPQASTLNRGDWKRMENQIKQEIKSGKTVSVKIEVVYPNSVSKRPNYFKVTPTINGKSTRPFEFEQ